MNCGQQSSGTVFCGRWKDSDTAAEPWALLVRSEFHLRLPLTSDLASLEETSIPSSFFLFMSVCVHVQVHTAHERKSQDNLQDSSFLSDLAACVFTC